MTKFLARFTKTITCLFIIGMLVNFIAMNLHADYSLELELLTRSTAIHVRAFNERKLTFHPALNINESEMHKIVYNAAPNCEGQLLIRLISKLSQSNNFKLSGLQGSRLRKHLNQQPPSVEFSKRLHSLKTNSKQLNIYIGIVCSPEERIISKFLENNNIKQNYQKKELQDINTCILNNCSQCKVNDIIVPYFIENKLPPSGAMAKLLQAVDSKYLVVGCLEDFEGFLLVLEKLMPGYFRAALNTWKDLENHEPLKHTNRRRNLTILSTEAKELLNKQYSSEYQFYHALKIKFGGIKKMNVGL